MPVEEALRRHGVPLLLSIALCNELTCSSVTSRPNRGQRAAALCDVSRRWGCDLGTAVGRIAAMGVRSGDSHRSCRDVSRRYGYNQGTASGCVATFRGDRDTIGGEPSVVSRRPGYDTAAGAQSSRGVSRRCAAYRESIAANAAPPDTDARRPQAGPVTANGVTLHTAGVRTDMLGLYSTPVIFHQKEEGIHSMH
ncbi:MAG: hypothetical protein JWN15_4218 [Firmicutes bacterium]|nr:hypothetical protein [Bacillota bacterium]